MTLWSRISRSVRFLYRVPVWKPIFLINPSNPSYIRLYRGPAVVWDKQKYLSYTAPFFFSRTQDPDSFICLLSIHHINYLVILLLLKSTTFKRIANQHISASYIRPGQSPMRDVQNVVAATLKRRILLTTNKRTIWDFSLFRFSSVDLKVSCLTVMGRCNLNVLEWSFFPGQWIVVLQKPHIGRVG